MRCKACDKRLSEAEQKINEWGFLEDMCNECLDIGRSSIHDSDTYELRIIKHIDVGSVEGIPGWASCVKEVDGYLIAFEEEPLWDEEKREFLSFGKSSIVSQKEEEKEEEEEGVII